MESTKNQELTPTQEQSELIAFILANVQMENKKRRLAYFRGLNPLAKTRQIVFAGFSLIEQFPIEEFAQSVSMPLAVYNRGVGGFTCNELLDAIDDCILDLKPQSVYLTVGTNDLNDPACTIEELLRRYKKIVHRIRARLPDTAIIILKYYPIQCRYAKTSYEKEMFKGRTKDRLAEANTALRALAEQLRCRFLDVNKGLSDEMGNLKKELTQDGLHLTPEAYKIVLNNLLPYMNEMVEKRPEDAQ